jgi:hypothetical protein
MRGGECAFERDESNAAANWRISALKPKSKFRKLKEIQNLRHKKKLKRFYRGGRRPFGLRTSDFGLRFSGQVWFGSDHSVQQRTASGRMVAANGWQRGPA